MERDQILLHFERLLLDHVRKAKKAPTSKAKMHTNTIPAMVPEFNDDVEEVLLFREREVSEDVGGDNVDEDVDTDETSEVDEVEVEDEVEVGGVDIRDDEVCEELILTVVTVVVVFNEILVRLSDWEVVECGGLDVETSGRISMTVTVVGVGSPVLSPLLVSSKGLSTMSFTMSDELTLPGRSTQ